MLEVRNLRTAIGHGASEIYPVDGIEFDLDSGETLGVVGESGSGKSMTALSVAGLLPRGVARVVEGQVLLDGSNLLSLSDKQMRAVRGVQLTYMPQDPVSSLNPALTVGHQVTETLRAHRIGSGREAVAAAVALLSRVGIPNLPSSLDSYPHQLSGGMKQRVLLAMAVIGKPKVLIADEPTTAVDVTTQAEIISLLEEIQAETALAIVLITHDLGVVARVAKRVLVMYAGRVVEYGDAEQVFYRPWHPYTQGLLESVKLEQAKRRSKLVTIEGSPPQLDALPSGCPFHPRCRYAMDVCSKIAPPLTKMIGEEGSVACHLGVPLDSLGRNRGEGQAGVRPVPGNVSDRPDPVAPPTRNAAAPDSEANSVGGATPFQKDTPSRFQATRRWLPLIGESDGSPPA